VSLIMSGGGSEVARKKGDGEGEGDEVGEGGYGE
jgi:hypothetical protein